MNKALTRIYNAYQKGFIYIFHQIIWRIKFYIFRFLKVKKVTTAYGVKCLSDFDDATFRFYFLASYGFFYSNFLRSYSSNFIFIDLGANKGLYSIIAAKNSNCEKVISFEPVPSTYDFLIKNCSLNNISKKCDLYNLAVSDICEVKKIYFNKLHSGKASLALLNDSDQSNAIHIRSVDKSIFDNLNPKKNQNYLLKVDVEGFEHIVLNEVFKCKFSNYITNIFYEVDERWIDPSCIKKLMLENGFTNFKKLGIGSHYDIMASK
jgi:FkbM family methyltransferase